MNDLHLKYKFTDRGGNLVYEKYDAEDRITLLKPLGEIRLVDNVVSEMNICYRNHDNIVCKCSLCNPKTDG
jgi:hypothetical protein